MRLPEEIEKAALKLEEPPDRYEMLEIHLFLVLKEIYKDFYNGRISKEQGAALKCKVVASYRKLAKEFDFCYAIYSKFILDIPKTEALRIQLRKELKEGKGLETAIKLIEIYAGEEGTWGV